MFNDFDAVSGDGCRIIKYNDVKIIDKIIVYDKIDSTNEAAKRYAKSEWGADNLSERNGVLVVAAAQTAGKGSRGRKWESPAGKDIFMSLLIKPQVELTGISMITLVAAMATVDAIKKETTFAGSCINFSDIVIKWPNDIVINGRKVCGILTQMGMASEKLDYCIIGVGINVNTDEFAKDIKDVATSLKLQTGHEINLEKLITEWVAAFEKRYETFCKTKDMSLLMEEYNQMLINKDRRISVEMQGERKNAVAKGIDKDGRLVVLNQDGTVTNIVAGEVSVRGLYGYV